jgi:hypothetical protein
VLPPLGPLISNSKIGSTIKNIISCYVNLVRKKERVNNEDRFPKKIKVYI